MKVDKGGVVSEAKKFAGVSTSFAKPTQIYREGL